jgi:hypothetical protein
MIVGTEQKPNKEEQAVEEHQLIPDAFEPQPGWLKQKWAGVRLRCREKWPFRIFVKRGLPKPRKLWGYRFRVAAWLLLTFAPITVWGFWIVSKAQNTPAASFEAIKLILVAITTGILTLTGAFIGSFLQSQREKEKDLRQLRKDRTKCYRDYLTKLMSFGQRVDLVMALGESDKKWADIEDEERKEMIRTVPPMQELSTIEDDTCRRLVDHAIKLGIAYWNKRGPDRPSPEEVRKAYETAMRQMDYYDSLF